MMSPAGLRTHNLVCTPRPAPVLSVADRDRQLAEAMRRLLLIQQDCRDWPTGERRNNVLRHIELVRQLRQWRDESVQAEAASVRRAA